MRIRTNFFLRLFQDEPVETLLFGAVGYGRGGGAVLKGWRMDFLHLFHKGWAKGKGTDLEPGLVTFAVWSWAK